MGDPPRLATGAPYEDSTVLAEPLAFETFFETEAQTLFRRLCIVTGNSAAEEVVQDAFLPPSGNAGIVLGGWQTRPGISIGPP
jgi:hypothetical protein